MKKVIPQRGCDLLEVLLGWDGGRAGAAHGLQFLHPNGNALISLPGNVSVYPKLLTRLDFKQLEGRGYIQFICLLLPRSTVRAMMLDVQSIYRCWSVNFVTSHRWDKHAKYEYVSRNFYTNLRVISGEGDGTPLWYFCLENPMDGGAWWAAVHGVAESRTWLSDFTFTFHFHALEKEMATHSSVLAWRIPGMAEPGGLPSMGSHRVGHDWSDLAAATARVISSVEPDDKFGPVFCMPFKI